MGYIVWTKSWSASDNGTIFGGADIQNIQSDITTVVNGGLSNTNFASDAAIAESKIAFDISTGHDHDGTDSKLVTLGAYHYIAGAELVYVSAGTLYVNPGVIELEGELLSRTSASTTVNLATAGDWVQGGEGANQWVYVYAYNDTGSSWDIKLSDQVPTYYDCNIGHTTGILRYRDFVNVWYRCIGAVRNDASSNILQFYQEKDVVWYLDEQSFTCGTAATFTEVDLTAVVPAIADEALIMASHAQTGARSFWRNPNSATDSNQNCITHSAVANTREPVSWMLVTGGSTYSKAVDYKESEVTNVTGYVAAWRMNVR